MNISKLCIFQCRCIFYFSCGGVVVVGGDGGGGTTKFSLVKMVEGGRRTPRGVYIEPLYPPPFPLLDLGLVILVVNKTPPNRNAAEG